MRKLTTAPYDLLIEYVLTMYLLLDLLVGQALVLTTPLLTNYVLTTYLLPDLLVGQPLVLTMPILIMPLLTTYYVLSTFFLISS